MKFQQYLLVILTLALFVAPAFCIAQDAQERNPPLRLKEGEFRLRVQEDLFAEMKNTMVLRIEIETLEQDVAIGAKLKYDAGGIQHSHWTGETGEPSTLELVFAFQFIETIDSKKIPPSFSYSIQQEFRPNQRVETSVSTDHGTRSVKGRESLSDVVSFKVTDGDYDIRTPLEIGTLLGKPIILHVGPKKGWGQ